MIQRKKIKNIKVRCCYKYSINPKKEGFWTADEHAMFLKGYQKYGKKWTKIAKEFVPTRTAEQVANHARRCLKK